MARDFNIRFSNVSMDSADNLLENTRVTKVTLVGNNNFVSLDSTFKDCVSLIQIVGSINLDGVSDIDNLLSGNTQIKSITLKNINNKDITSVNAFENILSITIGGSTYDKGALQNVISSQDWRYEGFTYEDIVKENIFINDKQVENTDKMIIQDTLEQKATTIEIHGELYENLINGKDSVTLIDELVLEYTKDSSNEFKPHAEMPVYIKELKGTQLGLGELQEDGTYKIDIMFDNGYEKLWEEL